jgi:PAS domain S-box-containing protein
VSSAYCDITGRSREDLLGWGFISTIYEPEQSEMRELIEEGVKDRRKFDIQYTIQRRDGSLVKVAHYWQPMFRNLDIEDEFYGFMGRIVTLES